MPSFFFSYLYIRTIPKITKPYLYLRFGDIPDGERSSIYKGDLGKIGEEEGVSCYRGVVIDDKVYIIMPHLASTTYYWLIDSYNRGELPLYVIEGDEIGYGADLEPLLRNVRIIKKIDNWTY